jgi:hypothetical protein
MESGHGDGDFNVVERVVNIYVSVQYVRLLSGNRYHMYMSSMAVFSGSRETRRSNGTLYRFVIAFNLLSLTT